MRRLPAESDALVLDMARFDMSGRLSARVLLQTLGWRAGQRVEIDVIDGAMVITSAEAGRHVVDARGQLALPTTARRLCGIVPRHAVVLTAYPPLDLLVIHRASMVAWLLCEFHARSAGAHNAG